MAVFVAEVEVEACPLEVVGTLGCRYACLVQPLLKHGRYLWASLLHGNAFG